MLDIDNSEPLGEKFNLQTYLNAREICKKASNQIKDQIKPGMNEADGQKLIKEIFKQHGVEKFWHPSKFRVAAETVKSFREPPDQQIHLSPNDICFLDLGPIIEGHEADFGFSFLIDTLEQQSELYLLSKRSEILFEMCRTHWLEKSVTGKELYEFATEQAQKWGYRLNPNMAGHRLGDFPHRVYSAEKLSEIERKPIENLWVLEIHLIDDRLQRGSFYEDILYR